MTEEKAWEDVTGDGGVLKRVVQRASSTTSDATNSYPEVGEEVNINYTGKLLSGVEFDTNMMFGSAYSKTFDIVIGTTKVISGMVAAVRSMRVGEKSVFRIREDYAYGEEGSPGRGTSPAIPSRATIEFEIELVGRSGSTEGVVSEKVAKKLAEDERRAALIAVREEKALQREQDRQVKDERKASAAKKNKKEEGDVKVEGAATVKDARWAKSLKPNELKQELKSRDLSTQGAKKDLLTRLIADIQAKLS